MLIPDKKKHLSLFSRSLHVSPCLPTTPHLYLTFRGFEFSSQYLLFYIYYTLHILTAIEYIQSVVPVQCKFLYLNLRKGNLLLFIFMGCASSLRLLCSSSASARLGLLLIFYVNLNQDKEKDIVTTVLHYNNKSFSNIVLPRTLHISIVFR